MSMMKIGYFEQINPIAETADNQLVAADAKLNFDDNAAYRQKEIFSLRDTTQEDPREVYFLFCLCFTLLVNGAYDPYRHIPIPSLPPELGGLNPAQI